MAESIVQTLKIRPISSFDSMKDAHFFNSANFLANKPFEVMGWQLIRRKPIAQVFFYLTNNTAISGNQATFGSLDTDSSICNDDLNWFVSNLVKILTELSIKKIVVRASPDYWQNSTLINGLLLKLGFQVSLTEVNQHINITDSDFTEISKRNEVKKINQCINNGFVFALAENKELPEIYQLLVATRARKNYNVSMSFYELETAINANPSNYVLFTVMDKKKIIAASVSVIINKDVLYNFYHADDDSYRNFSPITFLVKNIYVYCQQNQFKILDLGISSKEGLLNDGLFNFKKNLGANTSDKKVFTRLL